MKWQLQETRALQVEFSSILPTDGYRLSLFGRGPIALHGLVHFLNTIGPSLTKVIYAYFDRISHGLPDLGFAKDRIGFREGDLHMISFRFFQCVETAQSSFSQLLRKHWKLTQSININ